MFLLLSNMIHFGETNIMILKFSMMEFRIQVSEIRNIELRNKKGIIICCIHLMGFLLIIHYSEIEVTLASLHSFGNQLKEPQSFLD